MNKIELKRCTCCGGEAQFRNTRILIDKGIYVKCKNCGLRTKVVVVDHPAVKYGGELDESTRYTEEQAVEKAAEIWNRREYHEQ